MDVAARSERRSHRTRNDVSALCVELLRAVREQEFRNQHRTGSAPSIDRAWRAWRTDLDRYGPLHLVADGRGLREGESGPPVGRGRLDDLAQRLRDRVLASVLFEPGLDAPTYAAFVSLLVAEPGDVERHGGPSGFLPDRGVGIRLLGPEANAEPEEEKPDESGDVTIRMLPAEMSIPIEPAVARPVGAKAFHTNGEAPQECVRELAESSEGPPERSREAALVRGTEALAALVSGGSAATYEALVGRAVAEAAAWSEAGNADACNRTVLTLASHAGEKSGKSAVERAAALGGLRELCSGRVLADLLARATAPDRQASLRASQVLLRLSEQAAPALLSAIDLEAEPARREELLGIAIALGRATTPTLHRALEGSSPNRARIAARIVGETRDERTVPTLSKLLDHESAEVRGEAARALARIGNVAALTTLKRGLSSRLDDVSSLCAYCLGVTGTSEAARALTETLRQARRARRTQLASAVIRSLGRLGREESVPELKRVIDKRSFFRRQEIRELKLQAISALAKVPGTRSREVLEAVAAGPDTGLAVAARRALKATAQASA